MGSERIKEELVAFAIRHWRRGYRPSWIVEEIEIVYGVKRTAPSLGLHIPEDKWRRRIPVGSERHNKEMCRRLDYHNYERSG